MVTDTQLNRPAAPPRSRDNIFNLLRLCLAIMVIFSHSYPTLRGISVLDPTAHLLRDQKDLPFYHAIDAGLLAVYGFFAISGYLVTMSWQNSRGLRDYLKKRVLRICPGFAAAYLISVLVAGRLMALYPEQYFHEVLAGKKELLLQLVLLKLPWTPPLQNDAVINGSLWTISFEFWCYLVVAALGTAAFLSRRILPRVVVQAAPALLFAFTYVVYCAHCAGHLLGTLGLMDGHLRSLESSRWVERIVFISPGNAVSWSRQFVYFAAGMCLYLYRDTLLNRRALVYVSVAVLAASVALVPALAYTLPIFGAYALIALCLVPSRTLAQVGRKADLSYGLYLYAFPVQQVLVLYFGRHLTPVTLFLVALALTAVFATASWFGVEKPFLSLKPKGRLPDTVAAAPVAAPQGAVI